MTERTPEELAAYETGKDAYYDGEALEDNPHDRASTLHTAWADGWNYAEDNDPLADDFPDSDFGDDDDDGD